MSLESMPVSFQELLDSFEFANIGGLGEHQAFVCRETGRLYWRSEWEDEPLEELPEDIEDEEKYIALPDRWELRPGKPLALDFAREFIPDEFDEVRYMFSKRGAYSKFKALLVRRNAIQLWYDFEAKATERALRDWCEANSIELAD